MCTMLVFGSISADIRAAAVSGNDPQRLEMMEEAADGEPEIAGEAVRTGTEIIGETSEKDEEKETSAVSGNDPQEEEVPGEQYHFVEEDRRTIEKWLELYCAGGFEDLLTHDDRWWNELYDYERKYAEFLLGLIVEIPEDVYDEQELSECIRILESGADAEKFFRGTVYQGLTLEDLKRLCEEGGTLEKMQEKTAGVRKKASSRAVQNGEEIARVRVTPTGYSGRGHGTIYKITLGGVPALCISYGKSCRNSFLYQAEPGTYQKKVGHMAYFASHASVTGATYVACQIAAWIFMEDENLSETNVKSRAQAMLNISSEESMEKMLTYVWSFYSAARTYSAAYYEYRSDNPAAQILIVFKEAESEIFTKPVKPAEPEIPDVPEIKTITESVQAGYTVEVHKSDWQTGVGLEGCEVELFENGEYLTTVTTDEDGRAEYSLEKSAEFSASYDGVTVTKEEAEASLKEQEEAFKSTSYTYSTAEVTAPRGYVWEANEKSADAAGDERAVLDLTNERTLGAVELIKYDMESESAVLQGDAVLDGAEYGIYAAEDIRHQDKRTGVLYRKDELVQTAVIGKTPERNEDGYILNTDGSRHIADPGGEIAYESTPGKTLFGDLELGSYYIKEIKASEGYMLDEAVYPVTFTYKWQMVKIENRKETAGTADNGLTADDGSSSKAVYSGDYVIKQGIQFVKTSDNTYQTELKPIEGAGFSVYLISELSGVKDGRITPVGESWTADDVMTFYDYDFTGEKRAALYKRTGHEEWTEGDRQWLEAGDKPNEYYVKEMFTDGDGRIVTPELPFGTYVIAETTTPEHHVGAKPFIVYITGDGGVLYTDGTKQKIEKSYTAQEGIRYGDHKNTKGREGRILQKQRIINNTITKAYLRVLKTDEEFTIVPGAYVEAEEFVRGTVLKEGAEYRLKCITLPVSRESLIALNWKFDAEGYMSYYDPNAKTITGTAEHPFRTGFLRKDGKINDCYITLPQEVPIGTYELEEVTAPEGYVLSGKEQFVLDDSSERVNGYEIVDTPFPSVIFTINNGAVYPDGQMGTNKYALTDEYGNLTVSVLQKNQEQKGIVEITKHGEKLSGVHEDDETLADKLRGEPFREIQRTAESGHRDMVFEYEDAPVENACFEIVAAEDIYSQELQKDLLGQYRTDAGGYLIHREGDVAARITTDQNGWGYAPDLYIGKYKIRETTAGDGFVRNREEKEFEIVGHEQNVNFDFYAADYKNERQKLEIAVKKRDQKTGEPLAGAVYGLYAEDDIGELCPADTLIATCITGEDGQGVFDEDLPLGNYYVRELEGPRGYLTASYDLSVNGCYDSAKGGQEAEKQEYCKIFGNKKTEIRITKQDLVSGREIEGAALEIEEIETDEEGEAKRDEVGNYITKSFVSWVSKEDEREGHLIEGLQIGRIYLLSERTAPDGYGYAEDIPFKLLQEKEEGVWTDRIGLYVMENGEWRRAAEDILRMYDEREALDIEKSTIRMTQHGDVYQYSVDELRNLTGESLEQFTVTDYLPAEVYLTELWTGTYNESLLYDAEYMTDKSADWILWESGLSTEENHRLSVPEKLRTKEEHVTKFRFCFGTVGGDFGKVKPPTYMTYVSQKASGVILNEIELTAEYNGRKLRDKDRTETVLYRNQLSGYDPEGGADPLYEIVDTPQDAEGRENSYLQSVIEGADSRTSGGLERLEDESVPMGRYGAGGGIQTGDDTPFLLFSFLALAAGAGFAVCLWFKRKKDKIRN